MTPGGHSPATAVVITGGGSGIGRATAHAVAEWGRPVVLWDRAGDKAEQVAAEVSGRGVAVVADEMDVTAPAGSLVAAAEQAGERVGPIGGLVHAAGIVAIAPVDEVTSDQWDAVLGVNLKAFVLVTQALLSQLRAAGPGSAVVAVASIEALVGQPVVPAYCASKAGLLGAVRSLAMHVAPDGIRVNAVCPGYVRTPMLEPALAAPGVEEAMLARTPLGRLAAPEEVGRAIRFLLSDDASYVTAAELVVDGGFTHKG